MPSERKHLCGCGREAVHVVGWCLHDCSYAAPWVETAATAIRERDAAKQRLEAATTEVQEWKDVHDSLVEGYNVFLKAAEEKVAALTPFVAEIAGRPCAEPWEMGTRKKGRDDCGDCDPCRARCLSPREGSDDELHRL